MHLHFSMIGEEFLPAFSSNTYQEAPLYISLSTSMADLENFYIDPKDEFISFLSSRLQRIAESNDRRRPPRPLRRSRRRRRFSFFDCLTRPTISLQSYLERIVMYTNCSPACFVAAYIYLDRFTQCQPSVPINSFNVRWLILTSVMVAAKFMDGM